MVLSNLVFGQKEKYAPDFEASMPPIPNEIHFSFDCFWMS